jgi:hypothetical protein
VLASKSESGHDERGGMERFVHEDEYLYVFDMNDEGWAERERERDLMSMLIEAAHLKSAARAWYRHGAPAVPARRAPRVDA